MPSMWWQVCGWAPQRQRPVVEEVAGEACECEMMASGREAGQRQARVHAAGKRFSAGHTVELNDCVLTCRGLGACAV